ncbi:MAG: hypothetical protein ACI35R_00460 [Bacillus sp. (in: firmicutes)]
MPPIGFLLRLPFVFFNYLFYPGAFYIIMVKEEKKKTTLEETNPSSNLYVDLLHNKTTIRVKREVRMDVV